MEIEVSAFGNFSTDTGSTDCNQVNINVFRFWRSLPSVLHGANFSCLLIQFLGIYKQHVVGGQCPYNFYSFSILLKIQCFLYKYAHILQMN